MFARHGIQNALRTRRRSVAFLLLLTLLVPLLGALALMRLWKGELPRQRLLRALAGRAGVVYDAESKTNYAKSAVGSGPFTVSTADQSQIVLQRNDSYWGKKAASSQVTLYYYANEESMADAMKACKISMALPLSASTASELGKTNGITADSGISFDKVNQQRHVLYLKDKAHTLELMKKHAAIMGPKFRCVADALDREIAPLEIASWSHPKGGYFVSFDAMPGTAKRTLALCKEAGVAMPAAGATFPYGIDPNDSNIRIAPSFPPVEDVEKAIAVFCTCVKMSALEKLGV